MLVLDILKGLVNLHVLGKGQCLNWVEWKISDIFREISRLNKHSEKGSYIEH